MEEAITGSFPEPYLGVPVYNEEDINREARKGTPKDQEVCSRCGILIRPEGGHYCGSCGRNI